MNGKIYLICGLCLCVNSFVVTAFPVDYEYDEEQECRTNDDTAGIYLKIADCVRLLEGINNDTRSADAYNGFDKFVCCPLTQATDIKIQRPSERACDEYENELASLSRTISSTFLIVRGVPANGDEFPHIAVLAYITKNGNVEYKCAGTLISLKHILTAAHCVSNRDEFKPVEVMLGNVNVNEKDENTQRISISRITPHPDYKFSSIYNDVAIIELSRTVKLTNSVQPACLPTMSISSLQVNMRESLSSATLQVSGWGATKFSEGDLSPILLKASGLEIVEKNTCSRFYTSWNMTKLRRGVDDSLICVRDADRNRRAGACTADSGAPLYFTSENKKPIFVGIVSSGQFCGNTDPDLYTSVYSYLDWIESEVWG